MTQTKSSFSPEIKPHEPLRLFEVSVVIPCLNEAETLPICIEKALNAFKKLNLSGEVVVSDNGSTDNSVEIATRLGARVVHESKKGYGSALITGMRAARGKWLLMGDADDTYDFSELAPFLQKLREGYEIVIGNRLTDRLEKGVMPWKNRYIGTPVLTALLRFFYHLPVHDSQCGMRALKREAFQKMNLKCSGMEFASEMLVKAALFKLKIANIPISYSNTTRLRKPHLRPFRDGWRHLKFLLLFSPTHLFLIPASFLLAVGSFLLLALLRYPVFYLFGFPMETHWTLVGSASFILGCQILSIFFFTKVLALTRGYLPYDKITQGLYRTFRFEHGLLLGIAIFLAGFLIEGSILIQWFQNHFGPLYEFRRGIFGMTLMIVGIQIIFSSFFLSVLGSESTDQNV